MSKPIDFYAGYPNQQAMPKWVGVTLASLFGGLMLVAVCIGARLLWPARTAEASMTKPVAPAAQPMVAPPASAPATVATAAADAPPQMSGKHHHHSHAKRARAIALAAHKPGKQDTRYKHAQLYAKRVASTSRRDKRARDDLDKLLGM